MKQTGVVIVLQNLLAMRGGESIERSLSYLERPLVSGSKGHHAPFESPCLTVAEIELRLQKCGKDGFMLKVHVALEESEETIARALSMPLAEVARGIRTSLSYVSGKWPKEQTYKRYKSRGNH